MSEHDDEKLGDLSHSDLWKVLETLAYEEIDHHDGDSAIVHAIRQDIEPLLTELLFALHDTRVVQAGQQWTIPMGLSCGMEGELIIRVKALGPDHDREN